MSASRWAVVSAAVIGGCLLVAAPVGAAPANGPHIVAHPDDVMVGTKTLLVGSHFPDRATIELQECSSRGWIAPQDPCLAGHRVTVHTDGRGQFRRHFTVGLCAAPTAAGTAAGPAALGGGPTRVCYVGEVHPAGVDALRLVGAVAVTVTTP